MIDGKPSVTAAVVAWARAAADPSDTVTPWLVPRGYHRTLDATSPNVLGNGISAALRRAFSAGLVDHMRLRTAAIDGLLEQAIKQGIHQVVLLGAGLDARAYRLPFLAPCTVFEVDHPASQAYKTRKIEGRAPMCGELRHVAMDFAVDDLQQRLSEAGFDAKKPSFWVWEGVTMYLPRPATEATLDAISALSAPDSRLVLTYMIPEHAGLGGNSPLVRRLFSLIDEPLIGGMAPRDLRGMLRERRFSVLSDGSNWDWGQQLGQPGAAWALVFRSERMAFAARK